MSDNENKPQYDFCIKIKVGYLHEYDRLMRDYDKTSDKDTVNVAEHSDAEPNVSCFGGRSRRQ